tara:strand:- start:887 stop:2839 length:1953 start_codon:yes stop_codon:yes gene_type:complete
MTAKNKVAIYWRFSTDEKDQVNNSADGQLEACRQHTLKNDWIEVWCGGDPSTSGDAYKPKLEELKELVNEGLHIDYLLVNDFSRLTRKDALEFQGDVSWIRDAGAKLALVKNNNIVDLSDPIALSHLQMEVFFNNKYLTDISTTVSQRMRIRFESGQLGWCGTAPFGFDLHYEEVVENKGTRNKAVLVPNEDHIVVTKMFNKFLETKTINDVIPIMSTSQAYAEKQNVTTTTAKQILRNSIYAGKRSFGVRSVGKHSNVSGRDGVKTTLDNPVKSSLPLQDYPNIPLAVSYDKYLEVQDVLDANQKRHKRRPPSGKYKYTSLVRCGNCGAGFMASVKKRKLTDGSVAEHLSYSCHRSERPGRICREGVAPHRKSLGESEIEQLVYLVMSNTWMDSDVHKKNILMIVDELRKRQQGGSKEVKTQQADIREREMRVEELGRRLVQERGDKTLRDLLWDSLQEEKLNIEKLKSELVKVEDGKMQMLDFAESVFNKGKGVEGFARYWGWVYLVASQLLLEFGADQQKIEKVADVVGQPVGRLMMEMNTDAVRDMLVSGMTAQDVIAKVKSDPEFARRVKLPTGSALIEELKNMGLTEVVVKFEQEEVRGRLRQVPCEASLIFQSGGFNLSTSVLYNDNKGTCEVNIHHQVPHPR